MKKRKLFSFVSGICCLLCYAKYIYGIYFYQDADIVLYQQRTNYNWLDIGRYGLVLLRKVFGTDRANPYYEAVLFLTAFLVLILFFGYFLDMASNQENSDGKLLITSVIFMTYPLWAEQFYFQFQSFEILAGYLLTLIFLFLSLQGVREKKTVYQIVAVVTAFIAFGVYQSFINVFLTGFVGMCLLNLKEISEFQEFIRIVKSYVIVFVIAFLAYLFLYCFFFSSSDYLQAGWGNADIKEILFHIESYVRMVLSGKIKFFPITYLLAGLFALLASVVFYRKEKVKICLKLLVSIGLLFVLFSSPFLLLFVTGYFTVARALLAFPLGAALLFYYAYDIFEKRKGAIFYVVILLGVVCCLRQTESLMRIFYTYDIISESDKITALQLNYDIDRVLAEEGQMPIAVIGTMDARRNPACCSEEETSWSFLFQSSILQNMNMELKYYWSTCYFVNWFRMYGIEYAWASQEQVQMAAEESHSMEVWPNEGGICVRNGICIIKLSDTEIQ